MTTYSFFNTGSVPGRTPMTLSDSSVVALIATLMRAEAGSANRGSTLPSFDSARISAKVWPEPVKSFSACAALTVIATCCPRTSSSLGSAIATDGMKRASFERSHGMSWPFGF